MREMAPEQRALLHDEVTTIWRIEPDGTMTVTVVYPCRRLMARLGIVGVALGRL